MARILVINGPNLNLLGTREPDVYGHRTLDDVRASLEQIAQEYKHQLDFFQSNAEHELIEKIHDARTRGVVFALVNPGALTHTSVALRDALLGVGIPFIEIHISNIFAREPFRAHSYLSDIAKGIISGLGVQGYELALQAALTHIAEN